MAIIKKDALPPMTTLNVRFYNKKGQHQKKLGNPSYADLEIVTLGGGYVQVCAVTEVGDRFVDSLRVA